jgi:hypothetical protein
MQSRCRSRSLDRNGAPIPTEVSAATLAGLGDAQGDLLTRALNGDAQAVEALRQARRRHDPEGTAKKGGRPLGYIVPPRLPEEEGRGPAGEPEPVAPAVAEPVTEAPEEASDELRFLAFIKANSGLAPLCLAGDGPDGGIAGNGNLDGGNDDYYDDGGYDDDEQMLPEGQAAGPVGVATASASVPKKSREEKLGVVQPSILEGLSRSSAGLWKSFACSLCPSEVVRQAPRSVPCCHCSIIAPSPFPCR